MGQVFMDLYRGSLPSLVQGGFDFVDIRDVVQGLISCAERGRTGDSYLMSGRYITIPELARIAETVTGRRSPRFNSPMWLARIAAPFFQGYAQVRGTEPLYTGESLSTLRRRCTIDSSKAERELGFASRDVEETVRDLYSWFDARGLLP
jgi:dihydroflavonol-4-reductase